MTIYRCCDPMCGGEWDEDELHYRRVRDIDPEEGWKHVACCPACGADVIEEEVCPICRSRIERGYFCDECIEDGVRQIKNFLDDMTVRGFDLDIDEVDREDFFVTIFEKR